MGVRMLALLVVSLLSAESPPIKLALPDVHAVRIDAKDAAFYGEHLAQQIKLLGTEVVTSREISSLLGLERQRQILGCTDGSQSCMAELASAMGADGVVLADLARVDEQTQINLKIVSASNGKTLAAFSKRAATESQVLDALTDGARSLLVQMYAALHRSSPMELGSTTSGSALSKWWIPAATGAVVLAVGVGLSVSAQGDFQALSATQGAPLSAGEARSARDGGKLKEPLGVGLMIAGGAAVLTGATMLILSKVAAPSTDVGVVSVVPLPSGGAVVFSGAF